MTFVFHVSHSSTTIGLVVFYNIKERSLILIEIIFDISCTFNIFFVSLARCRNLTELIGYLIYVGNEYTAYGALFIY